MTFSIDKALAAISERFTPEMREEQKIRSREAIGRINPNSPAQKKIRLRMLERSALKQIDFLRGQPDSELKTVRMNNALARYAELRAEQGDWLGAIATARDEKHIAWYRQIQAAIERPDDEDCDCRDEQVRTSKGVVMIPARFNAKTIQTPSGPRNLMVCAKCGSMNVK